MIGFHAITERAQETGAMGMALMSPVIERDGVTLVYHTVRPTPRLFELMKVLPCSAISLTS